MASVPGFGAGQGTTAVLGTQFFQGLAVTGASIAKAIWLGVAGVAGIVAGAVTLGRGRRVRAGASLED